MMRNNFADANENGFVDDTNGLPARRSGSNGDLWPVDCIRRLPQKLRRGDRTASANRTTSRRLAAEDRALESSDILRRSRPAGQAFRRGGLGQKSVGISRRPAFLL